MGEIKDLCELCHQIAVEKGWWDKPRTFGDIIALTHSELSEALEAYRNDEPEERVLEELADVLIRIFDAVGSYVAEEKFEKILYAKIEKNKTRPYRHGGKAL